MLPFNDSIPPNSASRSIENQQAYRELIHHLSQFFSEETLTERLNVEQMFILVDGVLPIEACLYYQVLPLFLDGSRLHLGMVNPEDTTASDYVRRIVSYLNYSLLTRRISSQALQAALSAYLKYSDSQSTSSAASPSPTPTPEPRPDPIVESGIPGHYSGVPHNLETNSRETLVLDTPDQLDPSELVNSASGAAESTHPANGDAPPILPADELTCIDPEDTEIIRLASTDESADNLQTQLLEPEDLADRHSAIADDGTVEEAFIVTPPSQPSPTGSHPAADLNPGAAQSAAAELTPDSSQAPPADAAKTPPLSIQMPSNYLDRSMNDLSDLDPRVLLRELLARAMSGGIGRLYFERKPDYGRVLWSQSGILQAAVDDVPPAKFQALINEFKRLTRLPLLPLRNTKQVELERFYKGNRVLLRFRFIPGKHGEQATLQVLRGIALSFYQQQQVARIGQDAVSTAKRLQIKISELRSRLEAYPRVSSLEQASLPELKQMLLNLEKQVDALSTVVLEHQQENPSASTPADTP